MAGSSAEGSLKLLLCLVFIVQKGILLLLIWLVPALSAGHVSAGGVVPSGVPGPADTLRQSHPAQRVLEGHQEHLHHGGNPGELGPGEVGFSPSFAFLGSQTWYTRGVAKPSSSHKPVMCAPLLSQQTRFTV